MSKFSYPKVLKCSVAFERIGYASLFSSFLLQTQIRFFFKFLEDVVNYQDICENVRYKDHPPAFHSATNFETRH